MLPQLTGDFMWTSIDYLGESAIGTIQYKDKKTKQHAEEGLIITGGAAPPGLVGYYFSSVSHSPQGR